MLQTCVSAVFRFLQHCPLPAWTKLGVSMCFRFLINQILPYWVAYRTGSWTWRHPDDGKTASLDPNNSAFVPDIDLLSHRLREGFRAYCYTKWQNTNRNDADMCREVPYLEKSCQAAALVCLSPVLVDKSQQWNMRYGSAHMCQRFWTDLARLQTPSRCDWDGLSVPPMTKPF